MVCYPNQIACKEATMFEQGDGWGAVVNVGLEPATLPQPKSPRPNN